MAQIHFKQHTKAAFVFEKTTRRKACSPLQLPGLCNYCGVVYCAKMGMTFQSKKYASKTKKYECLLQKPYINRSANHNAH